MTDKKETYRRSAKTERADKARAAKQERQRAAEKNKRLLEELKDDAYGAGASDKRAGKKITPYRIDLITSPRYEDAFGKRRAKELVTSAYKSGYRSNPAKSGKRNPIDAAADLAEAWHGRPAETLTDYVEKIHFHGVLMDAGRLVEIKVYVTPRHTVGIEFDEATRLASNEAGEQLYVVGGDQSLTLSDFGITGHAAKKDLVVVGTVYSVTYFTAKMHLGKQDKIPGAYEHIFKEHDQEEPQLLYDTMNQHVGFAGGEYHIDIDIDGKYSAGIRD